MNTRTLSADIRSRMTPSNLALDLASVIGLVCGFGLLIAAIFLGGSPGSFFNIPSILLVLGGTFSVVTICFSLAEVGNTFKVVAKAMLPSVREPQEAADQVLRIAEMARRNGVLSLQNIQRELTAEPFLHKCISMVIDGDDAEEVEAVMRRDLQATTQRHGRSADVLRKAAEFAPAMGLIGTLVGLVQMLGTLDDPGSHRPEYGGGAPDDILWRGPRQHGVFAAGGEARAQFGGRDTCRLGLRNGRRLHCPPGKSAPIGNAD